MGRFEDKAVVITGAAKGQGRSHALAFAREGADVVLCDVDEQIPCAAPMATAEQLERTVAAVGETGGRAIGVTADVRDPRAMEDLCARAVDELGGIDVLVPNAGIAAFGPFDEMTDDMWRELIDVNTRGVINTVRAAVPHMVERGGGGRIVATASAVGREGGPSNANYAASKWGVIGFVKSVALELAPHGITVNAISPMSVSTDMCHNDLTYGLFRPDLEAPTVDDVRDTFASLNPMAVPWLETQDATDAVLFLASDEARYVTGVALDIAAGWNAYHAA